MKSPRKSMHKILILEDEDLIATGSEKAVYPYPDDNLKLVKVLLKKTPQGNRSVLLNVLARRFPSLLWRQISKEYGEYTRLMLANQNHDFIPPISHLFGFVTTQKGLACVTEKVTDNDGNPAPTLRKILESNQFNDEILKTLNTMITKIYSLDIRAGDISASNIVVGYRQSGKRESVLVDGFGDIHAIPVRSMNSWFNKIGLDDSFKRLGTKTGLNWIKKKRQFAIHGTVQKS